MKSLRVADLVIIIDQEAKAVYVRREGGQVSKTQELGDGVLIDRDKGGHIVGVEVLALDNRG